MTTVKKTGFSTAENSNNTGCVYLSPKEKVVDPLSRARQFIEERCGSGSGQPDIAFFTHHSRAADYFEQFSQSKKNTPITIVHVDTHDDIRLTDYLQLSGDEPPNQPKINNYLTYILSKFPNVSEIYWVRPDWLKKDTWPVHFPDKRAGSFEVYVRDDGYVTVKRPMRLRNTVLVHVVTQDELPEFKGRKNIFLSIDQDFFANTGYNTQRDEKTPDDAGSAVRRVDAFFAAIEKRGLQPSFAAVALSPEYAYSNIVGHTSFQTAMRLRQIMRAPKILFEPVQPSLAVRSFLKELKLWISINKALDPRLDGSHAFVKKFNEEVSSFSYKAPDENQHYLRETTFTYFTDKLPAMVGNSKLDATITIRARRGDYTSFIKLCDIFGYSILAESVRLLQKVQIKESSSKDEMVRAYQRCLALLDRALLN